jgi:hypothetical protein
MTKPPIDAAVLLFRSKEQTQANRYLFLRRSFYDKTIKKAIKEIKSR